MQAVMVQENEGARIVRELLAMDVSTWKIAKACGVSYQTAKAWKKGWWCPDMSNTYKLMAFKNEHLRSLGKFRNF